jgi:putative thioredoxin
VATRDDIEMKRSVRIVNMGVQPRGDGGNVDAGHVGHESRTVPGDDGRPFPDRYRAAMSYVDVTDSTFQSEVIERSYMTPVVVDLWAPWCGPCRTLGPIIEKVIDATDGQVVLVKVNTDENPAVSQAFQVQSIPAVYALRDGQVVDGFMGAYPEHVVQQFVDALMPSEGEVTLASLIDEGTEGSFRAALELDPGNEDAIVGLAELLVARGENDEALQFLARIPETDRTRLVAAKARVHLTPDDDHDATLTELLELVKADEDARQRFLDILELMGPDDPRTAGYRKRLTARLF